MLGFIVASRVLCNCCFLRSCMKSKHTQRHKCVCGQSHWGAMFARAAVRHAAFAYLCLVQHLVHHRFSLACVVHRVLAVQSRRSALLSAAKCPAKPLAYVQWIARALIQRPAASARRVDLARCCPHTCARFGAPINAAERCWSSSQHKISSSASGRHTFGAQVDDGCALAQNAAEMALTALTRTRKALHSRSAFWGRYIRTARAAAERSGSSAQRL